MIKKFLIGTFAVAALAFAMTASAAYDFGTTTLKVGSKDTAAVKVLQTLVGATPVDGIFGQGTAAKVKVWQAANGLTADGVFGPASKAKANAAGGVVTLPSGCQPGWAFNPATGTACTTVPGTPAQPGVGALTGGAGDADIAHYSTSEKNSMKEGEEGVKVLGFKIEAVDSDIALNYVKVEVSNTATSGTSSERFSNYVDSVDVMKGSTKVGSVDASEFSRETGSPDLYTKTIALSNATVKEGDKDAFYVVFNANDSIDTDDMTAKLTVKVLSYRFQDATGVVFTNNASSIDNVVSLEGAGVDDKIELKSSSTNPDDVTVTVEESTTSDDTLALAFKLDVGDDSSDVKINELPITLTVVDGSGSINATSIESIIDQVTIKAFGDEYTLDLVGTGALTAGAGTATYSYDLTDEDITLEAGDVEDVKVYITFAEQKNNYDAGTTVTASVAKSAIETETDSDDSFAVTGSTSQTGAKLTLSLSAAKVSGEKWVVSSTGTIVDFFFTVNADNADINVLASEVLSSVEKSSGATVSAVTLTRSSGDTVDTISGGFTVAEGETTTFRARYDVSGTNGNWAEVTITSVAGQSVPDDKQVSPTATLNVN